MARKKAFRLSEFLVLPLSVSLGLFPVSVILAQTTSSSSSTVVFQPVGSPQTTKGGASRGICSSQSLPSAPSIVPLIPATDMELTTEAYPTVFVQIPDSTPEKAEFSIWDSNQNGLYQITVPLSGTPGIVGFKLPASAPPLAIGKRYKWSVAIICNPNERSRDAVVEGWMQRTDLDSTLKQQLTRVNPEQIAQLYAQNRIWYEALATLAALRRDRPSDASIADKWQKMLQSVGLKDLSQATILNSRAKLQ